MQARFASAVLLGFVLIAAAACSGSDGLSEAEEEALQERVEQAELEAAEAERRRQAEEEAREEAEEEAERERLAAEEAEEARQAAEAAEQEAEEARQAAEAERRRLAAEAEERRKADALERARTAIAGDRTIGDTTTLAVGEIEYGEPAPVTTPAGPFTTTAGRSGRWSTTSLTRIAEPERDMIQIYSDVEPDKRESFRTSDYNTDNDESAAVIDNTGMVVGFVDIDNAVGGDDNHSRVAASGSFPREIGAPKPFTLVDRGLTEAEYGSGPVDGDNDGTISDSELASFVTPPITRAQYNRYRQDSGFRDTDDFPRRYAYTTGGTLQGASGTYRCNGADTAASCTVQNRGGSFEFGGEWEFIPSSGSVQIVVPDAEYMWFGVWARQTVRDATNTNQPTEIWAFEATHGGNSVGTFTAATGTATYRGPAFGRYAVYEPDTGDSGIGTFTASATLQADFDATPNNTVSGSITNFSNDSGWSLALNRKNVAATETGTVTWTIDGVPDDDGTWEAAFYSNLETDGTITYQPHGIAGTFQAAYDPSGEGARAAVIGAFGAHR